MASNDNLTEAEQSITLVVRRTIRATPARLFEAWTRPEHLMKWWGPAGVACPEAAVDLRVGGAYRIANLLPNGNTLWITGRFERVEAPTKLVYSWGVGLESACGERVTVTFEAVDESSTEVVVTHERIADQATRDDHEHGWTGCLDGLEEFVR